MIKVINYFWLIHHFWIVFTKPWALLPHQGGILCYWTKTFKEWPIFWITNNHGFSENNLYIQYKYWRSWIKSFHWDSVLNLCWFIYELFSENPWALRHNQMNTKNFWLNTMQLFKMIGKLIAFIWIHQQHSLTSSESLLN